MRVNQTEKKYLSHKRKTNKNLDVIAVIAAEKNSVKVRINATPQFIDLCNLSKLFVIPTYN